MKYKGEKEYTLSVLLTTVKSLTDLKNRPKKYGNKSWFFLFFLFVTKTKTKRKKKRKEKKRKGNFALQAHSALLLILLTVYRYIILLSLLFYSTHWKKERKVLLSLEREYIWKCLLGSHLDREDSWNFFGLDFSPSMFSPLPCGVSPPPPLLFGSFRSASLSIQSKAIFYSTCSL